MAIVSTGYDTSSYQEDWWAILHGSYRPYAVLGAGDLKVTALTGSGMTCQVAAGTAIGHGVRDVLTVNTNVTFAAAPGSGTRYDLVSLRRDWSGTAGGPSSLVVTGGSASRSVPTRNRTPGTIDDQPLALVPISSGSASPGTPIDLRTWSSSLVRIEDVLAIDPRDWPIGTEAKLGQGKNAARYEVQVSGANQVLTQVPRPPVSSVIPVGITTNASGAAIITHNLGWTPSRMDFTVRVPGSFVTQLTIHVSSAAGALTSTTATVVVVATSGGLTRPYVGSLSAVDWTAYEGIA